MLAPFRLVGVIGLCLVAAAPFGRADDSAVARLARVLAAAEARDGKSSPLLLPAIGDLAEAQQREGAFDAAAAQRRRALDIAIAAYGCDSPLAAASMAALAMLDIERQRYLDAEPLLVIARRILGSRTNADATTMATILTGLARTALARGDTTGAEDLARRAAATARRGGRDGPAAALRALGAALTAERRFDEAERALTAALTDERQRHGDDVPETARSLAQLAQLRLRRGNASAALALIEAAAAIDQRRLGPTHPTIADDLHDLGLVYDALHRPGAARRAFTTAIGILERGAGRQTPRVAYAAIELSRLYREAGDDATADDLFRDARRILNKAEAEERRRERTL